MKLIKKLLPAFAAISAIGATTPMVTSCSKSTTDLEWSMENGQFVPNGNKYRVNYSLSTHDASNVYFNAIKNDPKIFAQDFIFSYTWTKGCVVDVFSMLSIFKLDEVIAQYMNVKVNDVVKNNDDEAKISFKVVLQGLQHINLGEQQYLPIEITLTYNNMYFRGKKNSSGKWALHTYSEDELAYLTDWSIVVELKTFSEDFYMTFNYNDEEFLFDIVSTPFINFADIGLFDHSYYMSDTKLQ